MSDAIGQVLSFGVGVAISPVPIAVVGGIVLVASGAADATDASGPATWVSWLKIVLGALSLLFAVRQWRGRPAPGAGTELLTVGAAAAIAGTSAAGGEQAVALAVFVLIGALGPGIPVAMYFALGDRARERLDEMKSWMAGHNAAIMTVLFAVIGAKLLGDGIAAL